MKRLIETLVVLLFVSADVTHAAPIKLLPKSIVAIESNGQRVLDDQHLRNAMIHSGREYQIFNLDRVDEFETELSEGLPPNEAEAREIFLGRVSAVGKRVMEKATIDAYQGVITAIRFGINRYPAVIFDGEYVVYGVSDMHQALVIYQRYILDKELRS